MKFHVLHKTAFRELEAVPKNCETLVAMVAVMFKNGG